MTNRKLAIVPAYNEQANVASVVREIRQQAHDFDVVVIDDGSTDETAREAEAAGAATIRHPFNLGIGGAVQSGYLYACEHGYEMAVQIDGDGQHDPAELKKLVARMEAEPQVDMVYGSRFLEQNGFQSSGMRRLGIKIFASVLSLVTRQRVTDPTSGFRLGNRRAIELFARDYPHDYPEVEAILMMHAHRLRTAEVAVEMRERTGGESSIGVIASAYYMIKVLLAVLIGLARARPNVEAGDDAPVSSSAHI
ncbi:MAG: glycosyltransferase family 2 protein [Thermoleophilaceae bacterium]|nr:glycosyltransferase family 2 protein [Thermoleophilaceae bacterium]